MEQLDQGNNQQYNQATLEDVFQQMPPEEAEDHDNDHDPQKEQRPPNDLIVWNGRKINIQSNLLFDTLLMHLRLITGMEPNLHSINPPTLDDLPDKVGPEAITKMAVIRHGQDEQVSLFAGIKGTDRVRPTDGMGGIDGGGGKRLGGGQLEGAAGKGDDKLHRFTPGGAGIAIAGKSQDPASSNDLLRRGVVGLSQAKRSAGE
jgi:hypothetical protein